IPNCGIDSEYNVICPKKKDYFCIGHNNELYKLDNNSVCTKTYTDEDNDVFIFIKDDYGFKEYTKKDSVTEKTRFLIYECIYVENVQSGCTTVGNDCYYDYKNQFIYSYQPNDNQFTRLMNGACYDELSLQYYSCDQGLCHSLIRNGYHLAGTETTTNTYDKLILCYYSYCYPPEQPTINGYYINGDDSELSLIKCINTDTSPSCSISLTSTQIKTAGYAYLDAGHLNSTSTEYGGVIVCSSDSCTSKSKPEKKKNSKTLYYIDAESTDDSYIIQCTYKTCKSTTADTKNGYAYIYGTGEDYIILGNGSKLVARSIGATADYNEYYLDATNSVNIIECSFDSNEKKAKCSSISSGANISDRVYYIDNAISGNIIECSNQACQSNPAKIGYYINGNNNADFPLIQCNKNKNDVKCQVIAKANINIGYYLDSTSTDDNTSYSNLIYCDGSKNCLKVSTLIKGYYLDSGSAIVSSSNKRSQTTKYRNLIICNGSDYKLLDTIHIGYYLDGSSSNDHINYTKIIYCSNDSSCTSITTSIIGLYVNAASTSDNTNYSQLITYNGKNYSINTNNEIGYYLDGGSSVDGVTFSNIIYCSSSTTCSIIKNENITNGYYIQGVNKDNKTLIKCINSKCKLIPSVGSKTEIAYYIDGESNDNIIKCDDSNCISKKNTSTFILLTNRQDENEKIIVCDTQCRYILNENSKCENNEDIGNLIYEEGNIKICIDSNEKVMTWTKITIDNKMRYYLLSKNVASIIFRNTNINDDNILIISTISKSLKFYSNSTYGYYINKDDSIYIECDKSGCKNTSTYNSCDSDENIGKLAIIDNEIFICTSNYSGNKIQITNDNNNNYYFIEKGFPGVQEDQAVVSINESEVIVKTGKYVIYIYAYQEKERNFIKKDKTNDGNEYISNTITKCSFNDSEYKCINEKANTNDYYYDELTFQLYFVTDTELESMEDALPGYYINNNEIIIIDSDSTNAQSQINPISSLDEYDKCDSKIIGKIFNSKSPTLCLDGENQVELSEENSGFYLLNYNNDNIFDIPSNQYALISISKNKAVLYTDNDEMKFCVNKNMSVDIKKESTSCAGKEIQCTNGICKESSTSTSETSTIF
ncbi:hypothetical protein PIROE2DRAFT_4649, partial [Piromyces sp. E2]